MSDRVVVITGAGRGIGRATAVRFAADKAQIVAASRTESELNETKRLVEQAGGRCQVQATDVCEPDDIGSLIESAAGRFGRIDALVNCAGVAPKCSLEELDSSLFGTVLSVNVTAIYHACRAVWPVMKKQNGGIIVNISSVAAVDPFPGFAAYGPSKAWVNAWTMALAHEGKPHGIRVYAVAPGAVETKMLRDAFPDYPPDEVLRPEEVADLVHAVTQPWSRYTTGQAIYVRK